MSNKQILMPALSPTMEEGTLSKWLVKIGDKISSGDLLAEIETDKATMEIEAIEEGFISKLIVEERTEGIKINTPIAEINENETLQKSDEKLNDEKVINIISNNREIIDNKSSLSENADEALPLTNDNNSKNIDSNNCELTYISGIRFL